MNHQDTKNTKKPLPFINHGEHGDSSLFATATAVTHAIVAAE